ncbi:MAG: hypothetical protein JSV95_12150 [Gemmatimonadota bacterium]|nr:MAG: hypothetical protein JSV95_12150 [Gemmatimonadota bacterium]
MIERPIVRTSGARLACAGVLSAVAVLSAFQTWQYVAAKATARGEVARRIDAAVPTRPALALTEATSESPLEFADRPLREADSDGDAGPPPSRPIARGGIHPDLEPQALKQPALAPRDRELALDPVAERGVAIGSTVQRPGHAAGRPSVRLGGNDSGIGTRGTIGRGRGLPNPFIILTGGSGCQGTSGISLPGTFPGMPPGGGAATGPEPDPTSTPPTPLLPPGTIVGRPPEPTDILAPSGDGRRVRPVVPDGGRRGGDGPFPRTQTPPTSGRNTPVAGAAAGRLIQESARSFGSRRPPSTPERARPQPSVRQTRTTQTTARQPQATPRTVTRPMGRQSPARSAPGAGRSLARGRSPD